MRNGVRIRYVCLGLAIMHTGLFTYFALARVPLPLPLGPPLRQMILHVVAYGILALLLSGAWLSASRKALPMILIGAALASFSYGVLVEALQALLPWRACAWNDLLYNGLGVFVGVAAMGWIFRPSGAGQEASATSCGERAGEMHGLKAGVA